VSLLGVTVRELISNSALLAKGMKAVAQRCDSLASVSMMDLSVEAEAFGSVIQTSDDEVPTVINQIVASPADAEALRVPRVGDGRTGLYVGSVREACGLIADRPVFAGMIGPFSLTGRLMGLSDAMIFCYEEPDMVRLCLEKVTEFQIQYGLAFKAAGAKGIVMAEPASGLLSPDLHDEFVAPHVTKIIAGLQDENFSVMYHNCGNVVPLLGTIATFGARGYHFGNAINIKTVLESFPANLPVFGNIDPSSQFRNGTPQSIYDATTKLMAQCVPAHPNFCISSGCDIPPMAPWANIDAFFKAVRDFYGA
jgi:uroporphyrinogen decarboxylase